jgi:4-diphosphocytidyl-2-C-methyl-D-erythritol kinase
MSLTCRAYAKINLSLEVLGKRPDGYHEILTVMQQVTPFDVLTFQPGDDLIVSAPGLDCPDSDNLVLRAAQLLRERTGCRLGARIDVAKHIPSAAGLGGGSSDAARTLVGLNHLWQLGLSTAALEEMAAWLGSDVPFFVTGGTALASGRGEVLAPLPALDDLAVVLAVPEICIANKTRTLYGALRAQDFTDGSSTRSVVQSLRSGRGLPIGLLCNAFERAAFSLFPLMREHRQAMVDAGAPFVRLSGSGPSMFTLVATAEEAQAIARRLLQVGVHAKAVTAVSRREPIAG